MNLTVEWVYQCDLADNKDSKAGEFRNPCFRATPVIRVDALRRELTRLASLEKIHFIDGYQRLVDDLLAQLPEA